MPKHYREAMIPADQLIVDEQRIYEPLLEALIAHEQNPAGAKVITVPAHRVRFDSTYAPPADQIALLRPAFTGLRLQAAEMMTVIPVLRRGDGSLWSYDDIGMLTLYHELAPQARIRCLIIGRDPAPPEELRVTHGTT